MSFYRAKMYTGDEWIYGEITKPKDDVCLRFPSLRGEKHEDIKIKADTLCEYTCKVVKRIDADRDIQLYTGDICEVFFRGEVYKCIVVKTRTTFWFKSERINIPFDEFHYFSIDVKIIGNKHDNPEIVEEWMK